MKRLSKPDFDAGGVYESCVSGLNDPSLVARFNAAKAAYVLLAQQYTARAASTELHLFPPSQWGNGQQVVLGALTKDELTGLYSSHMAKREQPARSYYDRLMMLAPHSRCPYCGIGQVSTLDHFMSKARYPSFSVLPVNLVPACADCNKGKGAGEVITALNQVPHPYFEVSQVETDPWLFASVNQTVPATVTFRVVPPNHWPADLATRIGNLVRELDLTSRFAVEAASEMAALADFLGQLEPSLQIGTYLGMEARTERQHRKNTWKAALYEALATSRWYCEGGYRQHAE